MKRALVVGGQHSFVKNKLSKSLERHGISIVSHWAWDKAKPPAVWPKSLDLIYICTDMVSHKVATPAVEYCRTTGIPYVNGTRKWAESIVRLTSAGFPLVSPTDALPAILDEHLKGLTPDQRREGPSETEMNAMLVALAGSVEVADSLVRAAGEVDPILNTPKPVEPIMPPSPSSVVSVSSVVVKPRDPYAYARDHRAPLQAAYIRAILRNPEITNKQIEQVLRSEGFKCNFDPIRGTAARQFCGVTMEGSGAGAKRRIDEEKFLAAAIELDVHDFNLGSKTTTAPLTPPEATSEIEMKTNASIKPTTAPQVTHVATVTELVRKLKAAMAAENFTELHITESGVQFKRVQVTEGVLDL